MVLITSSQNENYKRWRKCQTKKGRLRYGSIVIEGEHLVQEALLAQLNIKALIIRQGREEKFDQWDFPRKLPIFLLKPSLFDELMETDTPQGIAAEVEIPKWSLETLFSKKEKAMHLVLDAIQDPGNLGTIIRTAKAAGVDAIWLGKGTVDPYNGKVVRSAMGALFQMPLIQEDLTECLPFLKKRGFTIISASPRAGRYYFELNYPEKAALLLGNEGRGINPNHYVWVDEEIQIPMPGEVESLNVSVTSAILIYEWVRQSCMLKGM